MNFDLDENQVMVRDMVRKFAADAIAPNAQKWDEAGQLPRSLFNELGGLGMMGLVVPEQYGGSGLDLVAATVAIEEIARHDGSAALTVASHNSLCIGHLLLAGTEDQKNAYLPALVSGEHLGAWALFEKPESGALPRLRTTAERDGDGWLIKGRKSFVHQGSSGDITIVMARTGDDERDITAFVVERDTPGFAVGDRADKLGLRASDTAEIVLHDVRVSDENRLGEVNQGYADALKVLDRGRVGTAAVSVGIACAALEEARAYALERKQFGRAIFAFQAIQFKLADMATRVDAARLLALRAAAINDVDELDELEGANFSRRAATAQIFANEAARYVTDEALQIHGGYGYIREYSVERYFRDARVSTIGMGGRDRAQSAIADQLLQSV